MTRKIHGVDVHGVDVDHETRCAHYESDRDVIALKFHCCDKWLSCRDCHDAVARHPATRWPKDKFEARAVLCGKCGAQLTIREYLASSHKCPRCDCAFNPHCARHHHLYFETTTH